VGAEVVEMGCARVGGTAEKFGLWPMAIAELRPPGTSSDEPGGELKGSDEFECSAGSSGP
jgi:hypothetical protein